MPILAVKSTRQRIPRRKRYAPAPLPKVALSASSALQGTGNLSAAVLGIHITSTATLRVSRTPPPSPIVALVARGSISARVGAAPGGRVPVAASGTLQGSLKAPIPTVAASLSALVPSSLRGSIGPSVKAALTAKAPSQVKIASGVHIGVIVSLVGTASTMMKGTNGTFTFRAALSAFGATKCNKSASSSGVRAPLSGRTAVQSTKDGAFVNTAGFLALSAGSRLAVKSANAPTWPAMLSATTPLRASSALRYPTLNTVFAVTAGAYNINGGAPTLTWSGAPKPILTVPYNPINTPILPGADYRYILEELQKIGKSIQAANDAIHKIAGK